MYLKTIILYTFIFLSVFRNTGFASFEPGRKPCSYLARGSSGIASAGLSSGFLVNPALLALTNQNELNLFYRNYYSIPQFNEIALSLNFRFFKIPTGLSISQFGNNNYKEQELFFSSAMKLSDNFSIGFAAQLYLLQIKKYGNYSSFGTIIASHLNLLPWLSLATVVGNLNEPEMKGHKGDIPVYFISGVQIKPLNQLELTFDIFKDSRFNFDFRYGLSYKLASSVQFLLGFREQVHTFSIGLEIRKKIIRLNYAFEYHPELGVSNSFGVAYVL